MPLHNASTASVSPEGAGSAEILASRDKPLFKSLKDPEQEGESKPECWNLLSMPYANSNQFPEASQAVIKAVDLAPQRTELYFNLAFVKKRETANHLFEFWIEVYKRNILSFPISPSSGWSFQMARAWRSRR
jgi:hypothetical protein